MSYQLEKPIPTGIEVMEDLNYVDDELPVNEIIMEYMITRKKYRIKETLQKFRGEIDIHKICKNGTTLACQAVKSRDMDILKTLIEETMSCEATKELRTSDSSLVAPMRDGSHLCSDNIYCQYKSILFKESNQDYKFHSCNIGIGKVSQLDRNGKNILHYAILSNELDMVKYLIEKFRDFSCNQYDRDMNSTLHLAVIINSKEMMKLLLSLGAIVDFKNREGKTALHSAAVKGQIDLIEILLEAKSDINALDFFGQSVLMLATMYNQYETVKLLVKKGAKVNYEDDTGFTALKRAVYDQNSEVTKVLVQNGARICESMKLLQYTAVFNLIDIATTLIDRGARLESRDTQGFTPLMRAVEHRHYEIAELFLKRGADPNYPHSFSRITALHVCIFNMKEKEEVERYIDLLLKYGAVITEPCQHARDPLFYSLKFFNEPAIFHLVRSGFDLTQRHFDCGMDYMTACVYYSESNELGLIKLFLAAGFPVKNYERWQKRKLEPYDSNPKRKFLYECLSTGLTLEDLCRIKIRKLVKYTDIPKLPLSKCMIQFLKFKTL